MITLKPYNQLGICPDCNQARHHICVEVRGIYDGGLYWRCGHCGANWHRWPQGHYIRQRADQWLEQINSDFKTVSD